jgi:hypothetical protein
VKLLGGKLVRRTWKKRRQRKEESAVECFACGESGKIVRSDKLC